LFIVENSWAVENGEPDSSVRNILEIIEDDINEYLKQKYSVP
jgi:hypothetical protein